MSVRFSAKRFNSAERIAHEYFWRSDCPSVRESVKNNIEKNWSKPTPPSLAQYVAMICAEASHSK